MNSTTEYMQTNNDFPPGLVHDPASIAFLSERQYLIAYCLATVSTVLSFFGSSSIILVILRSKKLNELSNRLILGISSIDILVCLSLFAQPWMMREDSGLMFAKGNEITCDAVGFMFNFYVSGIVYNCALSIYFLLRIKYNKKDRQIMKYMEPLVHILAIGEPAIVGIAALFTENFNPVLPVAVCDLSGVYPPACAFRDDIECERGGTIAWAVISYIQSAFPLILSIVATVCTFLLYWTARRQLLTNTQYVIRGSVSSSMRDSLTPQQRKIIRTVSLQAVLYFFSYFVCFISVLVTVTQNEVYSAGLQDISELSERPGPFISFVIQYILFPLNGFLNMLIFFRPRIVRWKERNPQESWFWAYQQVLSGKSLFASTVRKSGDNNAKEGPGPRSYSRSWSSMYCESDRFPLSVNFQLDIKKSSNDEANEAENDIDDDEDYDEMPETEKDEEQEGEQESDTTPTPEQYPSGYC